MLINKSHKISTNVSFHICTIWGVEPNDLSLSRLTFRLAWDILNGFIVSTIFKSDIVLIVDTMKPLSISQANLNVNLESDKSFGSTPHIVQM